MKQLYDKAIYDFSTPIKSYWEEVSHFDQGRFPKLVGDHSCDVCVLVVASQELALPIISQKNMEEM